MKVFAAIDLRGGAAVQLVGGDPASESVRRADPAGVARAWLAAGFRRLHVVDLDAALGVGNNRPSLAEIARLRASEPPDARRFVGTLQAGGGVRSRESVRDLLDLGLDRVVVGTRAVEDRAWLERTAAEWPGRLVVAADVRAGRVATHGWTRASSRAAPAFIAALAPLPLAGVLVTDVGREGRQAGVDRDLFGEMVHAARQPLMAAGGITDADDLEALDRAGVDAVVLGMALYTGRLRPADALEWENDE